MGRNSDNSEEEILMTTIASTGTGTVSGVHLPEGWRFASQALRLVAGSWGLSGELTIRVQAFRAA